MDKTKEKKSKKKLELRPASASAPAMNEGRFSAHGNGSSNGKKPYTADGPYPYPKKLKSHYYEPALRELQVELLKVQRWVKDNGKKIVILFEGRDAAGKGGTIKRFREHLNPRGARVVALDKPNETEKGQWYFQRYIAQMPTAGEIVFFDRSWYNRAGVEPVMGFCAPAQYLQFMRQVTGVERGLIDGGITLIKLWFDVSHEEQGRRIKARKTDPLKHWKLSPMDMKSIELFDEYTRARDSMFFYTHRRESPWTVIRSDDKKRARLQAMLSVLNLLDYDDKNRRVVVPNDRLIVGPASEMFPMDGRMIFRLVRT